MSADISKTISANYYYLNLIKTKDNILAILISYLG